MRDLLQPDGRLPALLRLLPRGDLAGCGGADLYSVAHEQLHHVLASYKRLAGPPARRLSAELAAVLWRFLSLHERCVAHAAGVRRFELVGTVPSGARQRGHHHPLGHIVGDLVQPTRARYEPLLVRSGVEVPPRTFSRNKFRVLRPLSGEAVLLVDDTWTTGASAQSAAAALKTAGATVVAAVVIGRHLNRTWHENDRRLRGLTQPFDWSRCALCEHQPDYATRAPGRKGALFQSPEGEDR